MPLVSLAGFQATKWGEEALVDLPDCTWSGKDYEWVRRQSNYCRRQGLVGSRVPARGLSRPPAGRALAGRAFGSRRPVPGRQAAVGRGAVPARPASIRRGWAASGCSSPGPRRRPRTDRRLPGLQPLPARPDVGHGNLPPAARRRPRHDPLPHAPGDAGAAGEGVRAGVAVPDPGTPLPRRPLAGDSRMARWGLVAGHAATSTWSSTRRGRTTSRAASARASRTAIFACGRG